MKREPAPGQVGEIRINAVRIDEQQLRVNPEDDSIIELANDIAAKGLLQPIGVRLREDGDYQLLWGSRRLAAHKRLKRTYITAHVYALDDVPIKALALVENIQRTNLTLAEEVEAVKHLHEGEKKSVDQISAYLSKSRSWVLNRIAVTNLPQYLRDPLMDGGLPMSHVEEICKVADDSAKRYLTAMAVQHRWNRSQLRQVCETYNSAPSINEVTAPGTPGARPPVDYSAFLYTCQACGKQGQVQDFTLVRICRDGCQRDEPSNAEPTPANGSPRLENGDKHDG